MVCYEGSREGSLMREDIPEGQDEVIEMFLDRISPLRGEIEQIYLFGSRSRGDWRPDSDYDLLIVLKRKDGRIVDGLYDGVMDVLLSTGRLISLKIFTRSEFDRLRSIPTPFMQNLMREGIKIG
ncbi:MAG: hypothetical protein DRG32_06150 [Deltaproteobacteria bacterium]|nr:MAG: hypothetical protein DRG32_06150 [Deltaproteobacteria bacterium]